MKDKVLAALTRNVPHRTFLHGMALRGTLLILLLSLLLSPLALPTTVLASESYQFYTKWGTPSNQFYSPSGVAVDSSDNVYVSDTGNHLIQKFNSSGVFLTRWGLIGAGDGEFYGPQGVAVDSLGNVYVADTQNQRIQKFTSSGGFLTKWGSEGAGDGQFDYPCAIAVDSSGNVYVADVYNYRIQKFNSSGDFVTKWGSWGTDDNQFGAPCGIAVDSSDNVYVVDAEMLDSNNYIIKKFTSSGGFLARWGSSGQGDGQLRQPHGVAVDSAGIVYVVDTGNDRIQKFNSSGVFLAKWGGTGSGNGDFDYPQGAVVDSSGNIYVADTQNNRIQKFDSSGVFSAKWGSSEQGDGQFNQLSGVAVYSSGHVYTADTNNNRIQKFDSSGGFLTRWGGPYRPQGLAVDSAENVYVLTSHKDDIYKYDSNGVELSYLNGDERLGNPCGVAVASSGKVYVAERGYNRISVFDDIGPDGYTARWGDSGSGDGQFSSPCGVALDSSGNVYVADSGNNRIQKFSDNGVFLAKWGSSGQGDGQFNHPEGVAVDSSGNIYVADTCNHRIQKLNSSGVFLTSWGSGGYNDGQFNHPQGLAVDSSGKVYVADTYNQRIQVFRMNTFTITASAGTGGSISPAGAVTVNSGDNQTFTIAATTGYHIADVKVDETSVGAVGAYTFNNVTAGHTISASFGINTATSPRALKQGVLSDLTALRTTVTDKQYRQKLDKIIGHIQKSLKPGLWIDDSHLVLQPKNDWLNNLFDRFGKQGRTLDDDDMDDDARTGQQCDDASRHGIRVFHEEKDAARLMENSLEQYAKDIAMLSAAKKLNANQKADLDVMKKVAPVLQEALGDLVTADKLLAQVAITEARATPIKDSRWAKIVAYEMVQADAEFARADVCKDASDAITRYSHAWFHAQMAIKFATATLPPGYQDNDKHVK